MRHKNPVIDSGQGKLFIMFFILRLFFFPNYLNEAAGEGDKEDYVSSELIMRAGR